MIITRTAPATQATCESLQGQPGPTQTIQARLLNNMLDTSHEVHDREQYAYSQLIKAKRIIVRYRARTSPPSQPTEHVHLLAELTIVRAELEHERQAHATTRQLLDQERRHRDQDGVKQDHLFNWLKSVFANPTIPAACKLVIVHFYLIFYFMRPSITDEEMRVGVEASAAATGQSTSTVRRATDRLQDKGLLKRRYEPYETENGEKRTHVHITLCDPILEPRHIDLEKAQGGERHKGCSVDGERLNNYTVRHCPTHHTVSLYDQPGNPRETDDTVMIKDFIKKYENLVPSALQELDPCSDEQRPLSPDLTGVPQNASSISLSVGQAHTPPEPLPSTARTTRQPQPEAETSLTQAPDGKKSPAISTSSSQAPQKQDAFEDPQGSSSQETGPNVAQHAAKEESDQAPAKKQDAFVGQGTGQPAQLATEHTPPLARQVATGEQPLTPQQMTRQINASIAEQERQQDQTTASEAERQATQAGYKDGAAVTTPQGLARILTVRYCHLLKRLRCSVRTGQAQPNGSYYAVYDLTEVSLVQQGELGL